MPAKLSEYEAKREKNGGIRRELEGSTVQGRTLRYPKHAATRLHYDLRLELDGVFKS